MKAEDILLSFFPRHEIVFKTREELAEAEANARSIGAYNQPLKPEYIGSIATGNDVYHHYRDVDGRYYYISESTLQFEKLIKEHRKGRKRL